MTKPKQIRHQLLTFCIAVLAACGLIAAPTPAAAETGQGTTLVLKKEVANPDVVPAGDDASFEFTVLVQRIEGELPTLEYAIDGGGTQQMENGSTLTLAGGQTATFTLPDENLTYEIQETPVDGWNLVSPTEEERQGGINEGQSVEVTFVNAYVHIATKATVDGSQTVKAGTDPITVTDEVKVQGLLEGHTYTVIGTLVKKSDPTSKVADATVELESKGYSEQTVTLTYENVDVSKLGGEQLVSLVRIGMVDSDVLYDHSDVDDADQTITVEVPDEPEEPATGSLKISKTVTTPATDAALEALASDTTKTDAEKQAETAKLQARIARLKATEFTFDVKLTDAEGKALEGEYAYTGDATGTVKDGGTITLKDGQSVTIAGLPEGAKYTVAEQAVDNWKSEANGAEGSIAADGTAEASFTNTPLGQLKIKKTIVGATDEVKDTEFTFTVLFYQAKEKDTDEEKELTDEFSYTGDKTGTLKSGDTVTLKGGQTILFSNLPVGILVRVREAAATDWTASSTSLKGTTVEGVPLSASFTNTYTGSGEDPTPTPVTTGVGSLQISKTVATPATDASIQQVQDDATLSSDQKQQEVQRLNARKELLQAIEFTFTVTLANADGSALEGEYAYAGSKQGTIQNGGTITLKDGESVTIADLPEGTTYAVSEQAVDNWKCEATGAEGTIESDATAQASFTNTALGQLRVSKTVVGASTDELKNTEFTFTVLFYQAKTNDSDPDVELTDEFSYTGDKTGTLKSGGTVTLKGGQSISFSNLPVGITVRVREAYTSGWSASSTSLRGTTVEGVPLSAAFVNTYVGTGSYSSSSSSSSSSTTKPSTVSKAASTVTKKTTPNTADVTSGAIVAVLCAGAMVLMGTGLARRKQN